MKTHRMTALALAAGTAGIALIGIAGCGQPGHASGPARQVSTEAASPSAAAATRTPAAAASTAQPAPSVTPSDAATGAADPAPPATADTGIEVYANCQSPSFEPTAFRVTCGDAGWTLADLVWASWTSTSATATGVLVYNDCIPYCADGHFHRVPGTTVVLTDPRPSADGQLVFTRLTETPWLPGYTTGPMHGAPFPLPTRPV
jgi:hypothetical protein